MTTRAGSSKLAAWAKLPALGAALLLGGVTGGIPAAQAMDSRAPSAAPPATLSATPPAAPTAPVPAAAAQAPAPIYNPPPAPLAASPEIAMETAMESEPLLRAGAAQTFRLPEDRRTEILSRLAAPAGAGATTAAAQAQADALAADPVLDLHFTGLKAAQGSAPAVRVFLNKPDATSATSTEDPHFVGVVSFFPLGADGAMRFSLPLKPTLDRLAAQGTPVTPANADVTLVPTDLGAGEAPPFEARLKGMGLQAPQ